jgi:eukaryotic-like serine/threonine-protein kinase
MAGKLARSQRTASRQTASQSGRAVLKVGDLLASKYRVERLLGEGGMGVVVEAYHELLDQRVAVKLLYRDVADREAQSRLLLEARSAAKLQSDHVARVIDVDVGADGLPFIVMELLEGADLCQIADSQGALPRWLVVDYILQALEGLAHAHACGIVHRDLKPSNLFLTNRPDGTQIIKILDFGISKYQGPQDPDRKTVQLTGGRTVLGSPPYMSPEQVRSPKTVDHRTDIWSVGVCMYELLTDSMPFGGQELQETFAQVLESDPTPIRSLITGIPEGLEQVITRCLSKDREARFKDVGELARALVPFGSGTWIQAADRIQQTLSRAVMEDMASASRLRNLSPISSHRVPIPSSKRNDALQPELTGTASTVAAHGGFESKKRYVLALALAIGGIGTVLIGVNYVRRTRVAAEVSKQETPSTAPDPTTAIVVGAATATPGPVALPPVQTASVENDLPTTPTPPGTVLGASVPAPLPAASASAKSRNPSTGSRRGSGAATTEKPGSVKSPAPALPPGLPLNRSGT